MKSKAKKSNFIAYPYITVPMCGPECGNELFLSEDFPYCETIWALVRKTQLPITLHQQMKKHKQLVLDKDQGPVSCKTNPYQCRFSHIQSIRPSSMTGTKKYAL